MKAMNESNFTWKNFSIFSGLLVAAFISLYGSPYASISSENIILKRGEVNTACSLSTWLMAHMEITALRGSWPTQWDFVSNNKTQYNSFIVYDIFPSFHTGKGWQEAMFAWAQVTRLRMGKSCLDYSTSGAHDLVFMIVPPSVSLTKSKWFNSEL